MREFMTWHDIFLKFPQYGFSRDCPQFEYLRAHFAHEPDHIDAGRRCVAQYLDLLPNHASLLKAGMACYLDLYQEMFHELDTLIFK